MKKITLIVALLFVLTACTPTYADPQTVRAVKGGKQASITVTEYGDFQCPACGRAYLDLKALPEKYGDAVAWEFHHFPLTQIHPYAFNASMAAECANDQGKFWEYHDTLFENQSNLARKDLFTYAENLGLDRVLFETCFKSRSQSDDVQQDMTAGTSRGVNSTPTFYVNNEKVDNWGQIEAILDSLIGAMDEESDDSATIEEP